MEIFRSHQKQAISEKLHHYIKLLLAGQKNCQTFYFVVDYKNDLYFTEISLLCVTEDP